MAFNFPTTVARTTITASGPASVRLSGDSGTGPVLPSVVFTPAVTPKAPRSSINSAAPQITESTVAAADGVIPLIYGRAYVNGLVGPFNASSSYFTGVFFLCWGEIEAIESVYCNGELLNSSYYHGYTGTTTQTADAWMAAALSGYSDTNVLAIAGETRGVAYIVVRLPYNDQFSQGFPRISAIVKGIKCRVPGPVTADKLVCDTSTGTHYIAHNLSTSYVSGTTYTFSVYAKAGKLSKVYMAPSTTYFPDGVWAYYDIGTGAVYSSGAACTASVVDAGNGWWRLILTATSDAGGSTTADAFMFLVNNSWATSFTGDNTSGLYFWGAQIEAGSSATTYTLTTSAPAGVNLARYSEQFQQVTVWPVTRAYTLDDVVSAPDVDRVHGDRSTYTYTDNPAHHLADFLDSKLYGAGYASLNWNSVSDVADDCSEEITTNHPRRTRIGIVVDSVTDTKALIDTLRTYAGCMVLNDSGTYKLVSDKVYSGTPADVDAAQIMGGTRIKLKKKGLADTPTVVKVTYTDTSTVPWKSATAIATHPGVTAGTKPYRESSIALPGIQRYAHAYREALERLNAATLTDLSAQFVVHDYGVAYQLGDVISITHPVGLSAKLMRVTAVQETAPWRWSISAFEYDPLVYSSSIQTDPSTVDSVLFDPRALPAVTGLVLTEEVFQKLNGTYASRIKCSWDDAGAMAGAVYRVNLRNSTDQLIWTMTTTQTALSTVEVKEGKQYEVAVRIELFSFHGSEATGNITPAGKYLVPGDVPSLTGFEVGGEVRLYWTPAVDIDIWRYEVRYGATSGDWDSASLIDRVDGLRCVIKDIPEGTWRFYVKAVDSVRQESTNAAYADILVTRDSRAFMVDNPESSSPTLTNMVSYSLNRYDGETHYTPDTGDDCDTIWPLAADNYTNVAASYFDDLAPTWESEALDFGAEYTGNFIFSVDYSALAGSSVTVTYYTAPDSSGSPGTWESSSSSSFKATARFAKVKIEATAGNTFAVTLPGVSCRLTVVTNEESGTDTSSASAAKTITLASDYTLAKSIIVTPQGTTSATGVVDNVVLGDPSTFDVYVFDASGTQVARDFTWRFQGI